MIRNYLKTAWRNLLHNRAFSAINILGLALGMACSLLIFLWIGDELAVNAHHANGRYLYQVMERQLYDGKVEAADATPGLLAVELKKSFPEVVHAVSFSRAETHTFEVKNQLNKEKGGFAGPDWFRMFSVPLLEGRPETALNTPLSLVISRQLALRYFGSPQAALGQTIRVDNQADYQVTAVFEDLPRNAPEPYDYLLNWEAFLSQNEWAKDWGNNALRTYIQLRPDAKAAVLNEKMKSFLHTYNPRLQKGSFDIELFLHAYEDAYLYSGFKNGYPDGGRIEYVRLMGIIAAFILLIACINFLNLTTARSAKRAKEVGVRKVVGAVRSLLIGQFMGEALLLTGIALLLAFGLVWLLLPAFNTLTQKYLVIPFSQPSFWLTLLGITLFTGLAAGSYPALLLSSLNPIRVLKGPVRLGSGAKRFRQGLVVFQFMLSTLLIIATIVVYRQLEYVQTKNLGYDRENVIYLTAEGALASQYATFKSELLRQPGIQSLTYMDGTPTQPFGSTGSVKWPGKDPALSIQFQFSRVDYDFAKTLRVHLKGRDFSREFGTDTASYLINETAARRMGYADPIGQPLTLWGKAGKIIGVMADYHMGSLHRSIEPLIIKLNPNAAGKSILIRTQPGQTRQALLSVERLWKSMNPKYPFSYQFADEAYAQLYRSETMVGTLANYFASLAIFIACLGLFGLAAYTAEQRTKEIGVRKVLGASVTRIVVLLSVDFLKLVGLAIVLAIPLAGWAMHQWLQGFTYRISVEWWIFAAAALLAMGIALLTVGSQVIRAAAANPINSLRSE